MKERPILFSAPMVRAILEGRKTQTRRIVKPQPPSNYDRLFFESGGDYGWWWSKSTSGEGYSQQDLMTFPKHRFGKPGDRLWVRETLLWDEHSAHPGWVYKADGAVVRGGNALTYPRRSVPSIHLKRWASRITLEVESVRVERLNDCSREDARAEGCRLPVSPGDTVFHVSRNEIVSQYAMLWESINGPGSWEANPWVWVVAFKPLTPTTP